MDVIWKDISGYEGVYQVSNTGLVKSLARNVANPRFGMQKLPERILKPEIMKDGYLRVALSNNAKIQRINVHILVAKEFVENKNNLEYVNHIDENKSNNNYLNLEWCTTQYNLEYSISRHYVVTDPDGNKINVFNLSNFCKEHNLSISAMSEMATKRIAKNKTNPRSSHKGWKCAYLENKPLKGVLKNDC